MTCNDRHALAPTMAVLVCLFLTTTLGVGTVLANFDFTFEVEHSIKTGPVGFDAVKVHCVVTNTGTEADTYDILRDDSWVPSTWQNSICIGGEDGTCLAPFVGELFNELPLNPSESDTISIYFTPLEGEGDGYASLTVTSVGNNAVEHMLMLGCITEGCDVLIVDDDGGDTYETYYEDAFLAGIDHGTYWQGIEPIRTEIIDLFPTAIWFTGNNSSTLDAADRDVLGHYLGNGGRLLLTGQDIAYDLCDPTSPNYSVESHTWFRSWMNSDYVQDDSGSTSLLGLPGLPANGMALTITGGDGASNQTDPDVLLPELMAASAWDYSSAGSAAVRVEGVIYRAVVCGFGFEAISAEIERQQVLWNILDYLDNPLIGIGDQGAGAVPGAVLLDQPRPNPFNPAVTIDFALTSGGPVTMRVVDSQGRTVKTLVDGSLAAGPHVQSWDGRGENGQRMASGVYYVELRTSELAETRKVVLAK